MTASKTEAPTPKRLEDLRNKGEVPRSRDLRAALVVMGAVLTLPSLGERAGAAFSAAFVRTMGRVPAVASSDAGPTLALLASEARAGAWVLAPMLVLVPGLVAAVGFLETGALWAPGAVLPRAERLSPARSAAQLFSAGTLADLLVSLGKLALVGGLLVAAALAAAPVIARLPGAPLPRLPGLLDAVLSPWLGRVGALMLAVGVVDLVRQRARFMKQQRMSRDEIRREQRDAEGDPQVRHARQRLHREWSDQATLAEVRAADVLVVNPTHLAVALRYDRAREDAAPEVRAKGQDELARRMITAAEEAGVPVVRDVPLARALHELEEGTEIPEALYELVAVVLHAAWAKRGEGDPPEDGG